LSCRSRISGGARLKLFDPLQGRVKVSLFLRQLQAQSIDLLTEITD
jgi:hypothetical protein